MEPRIVIPFPMPTTEPPPREAVLARLEWLSVLRGNDHLVYASRLHGHDYFEKNRALADPYAAAGIAFHLAASCIERYPAGALLVGPASAGIGEAQLVADAATRLNPHGDYRAMYADKEGKDAESFDIFVVKRNAGMFALDLPIIVTEDVLTTGGSVRRVMKAITLLGHRIKAVLAICNRGVSAQDLGVDDLSSFLTLNLPKYEAKDCPLCFVEGKPINVELGHGAEFVKLHGQPPYVRH